ncbi:MAG: division/cell wall cluster transcriptional repressor MraZ [Rhodospirillales bacterium]|jgi:MraZ protein|nr:division/cell wall cluster transcriptional repressor MraZ [Rhodospirillales bacterium]MDP6804899.1 division/cell wall cluster transcriptional repressor MraZ [Rhodospirillales bacterium]
MALLVGRHVNKIDRKGRVSVPKSFRDALNADGFAGVFAYPSFKYAAIDACGEAFMKRLSGGVAGLDYFSDEQDDLALIILENADRLPFDTEGRIVLPGELMEHANLAEKAMFVGRGAQFRIWDPQDYERHRHQAFERARSRGATLKLPSEGEG